MLPVVKFPSIQRKLKNYDKFVFGGGWKDECCLLWNFLHFPPRATQAPLESPRMMIVLWFLNFKSNIGKHW